MQTEPSTSREQNPDPGKCGSAVSPLMWKGCCDPGKPGKYAAIPRDHNHLIQIKNNILIVYSNKKQYINSLLI